MMNKKLIVVFVVFLSSCSLIAQVRLPRVIRDSMVLQRETKVSIWGWAKPGEKIKLSFQRHTYKTSAGIDGSWKVTLPAMKPGGPYRMDILASNHLALKDILVGDVWFCSGQSNMVHQMKLHNVLYEAEIATANYPEIRQFIVPNTTNLQNIQADIKDGSWKWANPSDVNDFSAVAYFFAKKLYAKYHIPIGLINASWGGVPIESFMSEDALAQFSNIASTVTKNKDSGYINTLTRTQVTATIPVGQKDQGLVSATPWFHPSYSPKNWHNINIPGYWEDQGIKDLDGVVWYRREFDIPASMTSVPAKVFLGRIVDADVLYINGKQVGTTSYMYPQRRYTLPAGTLQPGKNLFVIRVINSAGKGGFVPDKPYQLIAGKDTVDLKGYWQYKVGLVNKPQPAMGIGGIVLHNQPTALYNTMVAPFTNYAVKGFVWYQGETNAGRANEYAKLQPAMIADWRSKWQQPAAPFLYVQLPGYMDVNYLPAESQWAAFREAQLKSLSVPNTAMAVAIDLGEWNDIHPDRKKEVGERLALVAEKVAYGDTNVVSSGPLYLSSKVNGNKMLLSFSNCGSGLMSKDGEDLYRFEIAGADKKFVWASAKIDGDRVVVWSDEILNPAYVRYAWSDNPEGANLYNQEGLPASPFRTDAGKQ